MAPKRRITIGVDFGTTFSGVAYSVDTSKDPFVITDWGAGLEAEKVPTIIRYNASDKIHGLAGFKWGYQVKNHERRQEMFPIICTDTWVSANPQMLRALDPMIYKADDCVDLTQSYTNHLVEPPDYKRRPTDLVADYLTALRKQVIKSLEQKFTAAALRTYRIEWVITTPAVWSMRAKDDTLKCAEEAGMGNGRAIQIVSELEAAAAYAFRAIEPLVLQPGSNIVICDAGGGTVDLITYRILDMSPLEVEESAISCGGKCGGVFVNRIFEKMLDDRLGRNSGLTDIGKHNLLNNFETYVKREFQDTGDPDEEYYLPAAGARPNAAARVAGGSICMTVEDLKKCFDPVVNEVIKLVKRQISGIKGSERDVSAVLLVGGLGQSRYLKKRLEDAIAPINLLYPPNGRSAIARGAVIKAMASRSSAPSWVVSSRKSTQHFGIEVQENFDAAKHEISRRVLCDLEGVYKCDNLMLWFVNRGTDLDDKKPRPFLFYRNIPIRRAKFKWEEKLLSSHHDSDSGPMYFSVAQCHDHVQLKVDLTDIPKSRFIKKRGVISDEEYYEVHYEILAQFKSAHVEYTAQFEGKECGNVKAHYCR